MDPAALCALGRVLLGRRLKPPQSAPSASLGASAAACSHQKQSLHILDVHNNEVQQCTAALLRCAKELAQAAQHNACNRDSKCRMDC